MFFKASSKWPQYGSEAIPPLNKGQIHIGRESWIFTKRGEARFKPAKPGRGREELFDEENERKLVKQDQN